MAKVKSPMLSMDASGQVGKSFVLAKWRGVNYARQHVVPANPRSTEQSKTRNAFSALTAMWKFLGGLARAPWTKNAIGRPYTDRNAFIRDNLPHLRGEADMTGFVGSPGAFGGFPLANLSAQAGAGSGEIDVTITTPPQPSGWTIKNATIIAVPDRDPATTPTQLVPETEVPAPTADADTTETLTDLDAGQNYVISAWLEWERPDGRTAYGTSLTTGLITATA